MKICKVTIKNINSLRLETTLDFEADPLQNSGLFAITGDTGAGKTTILDAITLALYGQVHRNKEVTEVMSYGATESLAEVEFDNGQDRYLAKWSMWRARNKVDGKIQPDKREVLKWEPDKKAYRIIAEKKREVDQVVEEVTGLDYDRFTRSVLLAQGDFAAFLQAGEKHRSDLLERITGTEIYTRLSEAAFHRHKIEFQRLEDLQRRCASLDILSAEQVDQLQTELIEKQERTELLRKELDQSRTDLQWVQRKTALEKEEIGQQQAVDLIEQEKADASELLKKLQQYQLVRPFETRLHQLSELIKTIDKAEKQGNQYQEEWALMEMKRQTERAVFIEQEGQLKHLRLERQEKNDLFETVIQLDITRKEKAAPLEKGRKNFQAEQERLHQKRLDRSLLTEHLREQEKEAQQLKKWLQENKQLQDLQGDLSGIEQRGQQWQTRQKEVAGLAAEQVQQEEELKAARATMDALQEREKNSGTNIAEKEKAFRKAAPKAYVSGRSELLERMAKELDTLNDRRESLQQLVRLSREYQGLLRRQDEHEDEVAHLMGQELALHKSLMTAMEMLDEKDRQLHARQGILRQQQMLANYEHDRLQLKDGEECPLCLSREHPFRQLDIKPFVDEAQRDLDRAKTQREQAYQHYLDLQKQQNEVGIKLEQLTGNERDELKGRRSDLQEQIEQYEKRITEMQQVLGKELLSIGRVHFLGEKLSEAERLIASRRQNRRSLQALHQQLEKEEAAFQQLREQIAKEESHIRILETRIAHLDDRRKAIQLEVHSERAFLQGALKKYGIGFKEEEVNASLNMLRTKKEEFTGQRDTFLRLEQETTLKKQQEAQEKIEIERLEQVLQTMEAELEAEQTILDSLHQQRKTLFGDRIPQEERGALEKKLSDKETQWDQSREIVEATQLQMKRVEALIQQRKEDAEAACSKKEALEKALKKAIQKVGLTSLEQARAILIDEEERQRLEQIRKNLEQRELEGRKQLLNLRAELDQLNKNQRTTATEAELMETISGLDHLHVELLQICGGLQQQLRADEQRRKEVTTLLESIDQQKREHRRWAKLNEIIGAADGKKFRIFAQGLTLARLVQLANKHLGNLNGRYLIRKRSDEDLALEIIDTYQADNRRSMNTLSGGECFLVSLALALGLSDLAGQRANIRSLFIDEGFGTLDGDSLDLAISTLENLQADGKVIGIISHIRELKERIAIQIYVHKKGNGFSDIEIVG